MRQDKVDTVKREIRRLAERINAMERYRGPKETGAVRRASMDVSRALADMRRSNHYD